MSGEARAAVTDLSGRAHQRRPFHLANGDFGWLCAASTVSLFGSFIAWMALPFAR